MHRQNGMEISVKRNDYAPLRCSLQQVVKIGSELHADFAGMDSIMPAFTKLLPCKAWNALVEQQLHQATRASSKWKYSEVNANACAISASSKS
jgi:hypothetical protein